VRFDSLALFGVLECKGCALASTLPVGESRGRGAQAPVSVIGTTASCGLKPPTKQKKKK